MRKFIKKLQLGALIYEVIDFADTVTNVGFQANIKKFKEALRGGKIKINNENLEKLAYVLGRLSNEGLDYIYGLLKTEEEEENEAQKNS